MKYLINHRYKVINSLIVEISQLIELADRGDSAAFPSQIERLIKRLPDLHRMASEPFNEKVIHEIKEIEQRLEALLHLPDNFPLKAEELLKSCSHLLPSIDPFLFDDVDPLKERREKIANYAGELLIYLNASISSLQGESNPIVDLNAIIATIFHDLSTISTAHLTEEERLNLTDIEAHHNLFKLDPNLSHARILFETATKIQKLFKKRE